MDELVPWPGRGRRYEHRARVGLADAASSGRARFDAIARWLQDAAWEDVTDAGLAEEGAWVVRRTRVEVARFPVFGERIVVRTFCGGLGRMWAERRTTIEGESGAMVETAALWVYLDPASGRPRPIDPVQVSAWEPSTGGRRIKARLRHEDPPGDAARTPWAFAAADMDIAGHVNNAAYWRVLEEVLPEPPAPVIAEIEYRAPADAGPAEVLQAQGGWWIAGPAGVHASVRVERRPG
jgi:acyl-ACP thioesterase